MRPNLLIHLQKICMNESCQRLLDSNEWLHFLEYMNPVCYNKLTIQAHRGERGLSCVEHRFGLEDLWRDWVIKCVFVVQKAVNGTLKYIKGYDEEFCHNHAVKRGNAMGCKHFYGIVVDVHFWAVGWNGSRPYRNPVIDKWGFLYSFSV